MSTRELHNLVSKREKTASKLDHTRFAEKYLGKRKTPATERKECKSKKPRGKVCERLVIKIIVSGGTHHRIRGYPTQAWRELDRDENLARGDSHDERRV